MATTHGCRKASDLDVVQLGFSQEVELTPGSLYTGDSWGVTASVLSLVTNMIATSLIGYKAWYDTILLHSVFASESQHI